MDLKELNYVVTVANEGSIPALRKSFYESVQLKPGDPCPGAGSRDLCLRPHYPRSPANCRRGCFYFPRKADPAAVPHCMQ